MSSQYTLVLGIFIVLVGLVQTYLDKPKTEVDPVLMAETYGRKYDAEMEKLSGRVKMNERDLLKHDKALDDLLHGCEHLANRMDTFEHDILSDTEKMDNRIDQIRNRVDKVSDDFYEFRTRSFKPRTAPTQFPTPKPSDAPIHQEFKKKTGLGKGLKSIIPVESK